MRKKPNSALVDDGSPESTALDFARARPASEVLPQIFGHEMAQEMLKPRGRQRVAHPKERIKIRLSHEVVEHFKSSGSSWQTRIDSALRQFIVEQQNSPSMVVMAHKQPVFQEYL